MTFCKAKICFSTSFKQQTCYSSPNTGVWDVSNVLDAAYDPASAEYEPHTLSIEVNTCIMLACLKSLAGQTGS